MNSFKERLRALAFHIPWVGARYRQIFEAAVQTHRINPGHYSSPIPSAEDVRRELAAKVVVADDSLPAIPLHTNRQLDLLKQLQPLVELHPFSRSPPTASETESSSDLRYYFDNDWFQFTDGLVLHGLLRHFRPQRIIEIGSGFSSFVILDTMEFDAQWNAELVLIEPNPERLRSGLRVTDEPNLKLINEPLQDVGSELFESLSDKDVLLVDSSHVSKCGSDVNRIIHEILPRLQPGVLVHFHDIFFPFRYPERLLEKDHYWNEAYILRAFLQHNDRFEIVLWNDYLRREFPDQIPQALHDDAANDIACSLWLRSK